jgi:hypothetical protein
VSTETLVAICSASFFLATALAICIPAASAVPRRGDEEGPGMEGGLREDLPCEDGERLRRGIASALLFDSLLVALAGALLSPALPDLLLSGSMLVAIVLAGRRCVGPRSRTLSASAAPSLVASVPRGEAEARPQAVPIL